MPRGDDLISKLIYHHYKIGKVLGILQRELSQLQMVKQKIVYDSNLYIGIDGDIAWRTKLNDTWQHTLQESRTKIKHWHYFLIITPQTRQ